MVAMKATAGMTSCFLSWSWLMSCFCWASSAPWAATMDFRSSISPCWMAHRLHLRSTFENCLRFSEPWNNKSIYISDVVIDTGTMEWGRTWALKLVDRSWILFSERVSEEILFSSGLSVWNRLALDFFLDFDWTEWVNSLAWAVPVSPF